MLARANGEAETLVLGLDANASGMAEAASRTARNPRPRGLPNALRLLLSVTERDAGLGLEALDERTIERMARALEACGLTAIDRRPATAEDVDAARSSWARRLRAGAAVRPAWLMRFAASGR